MTFDGFGMESAPVRKEGSPEMTAKDLGNKRQAARDTNDGRSSWDSTDSRPRTPPTSSFQGASASPAPAGSRAAGGSNAGNSGRWRRFVDDNKGPGLMVLSQFFGAGMAAVARLLELRDVDGPPMHPFQILFVRMSVTVVASLLYMWLTRVPDAPLGPREVRLLLVARGVGGFFGVFGLYYSLIYLPLAEATVITFLAPLLAAWLLSLLAHTPFTRVQQLAGLISMCGVVLIAQPFTFSLPSTAPADEPMPATAGNATGATSAADGATGLEQHVTPAERATGVGFALLGVLGAAAAYVTLTRIGARAHPLVSVTYFSAWCCVVSGAALLAVPGVDFRLPVGAREWLLTAALGVSGFVMQFLLTAALAAPRGSGGRALNFVYTQMLFALGFDEWVFGTQPGWVSVVGGALILGSAIWVAVRKDKDEKEKPDRRERGDEEIALMSNHANDDAR